MKLGEEKGMGPLFPRLHVNDADKGGPRAPPRNKMALYEQLSVPSKRFNPGPVSSLSLPPYSNNGSTMGGLSASSSQDGRHERSVFSPFYMPLHPPAHSVENVHSCCSSDGMNFNGTTIQPERRLMMHANSRSLDASGSVAECGSVHQHDSLFGKKLLGDKLDANDNERSQSEQRREKGFTIKKQKKSVPFLHIRENLAGPSNTHKVSPEQDLSKTIKLNESSHVGSEVQYKKSCGNAASVRNKCLNDNGSRDALRDKSESFSKFSLDDNGQSQNVAVDHNQERDDKASGSPKLRDAERNEACDAPLVDSLSVQEVSLDDIVGSIGPKHFWNTRSAIVNQQRVFAIQVFELHRLIKVQKLIAASPNILLEGNHCLKQIFTEGPPRNYASRVSFENSGSNCQTER
ncbi:hypothetical protein J5N97_004934 [Dioscorea zingiberensis]|uniref:Uncharacterized protein n=1 Tax=Dioscorea zingiberensis TaxID=325984 RepID=A0A9D5D7J5_9LILI|nr:hypothetical protein J5N97_004934 [Dioscorea zingiberensis]